MNSSRKREILFIVILGIAMSGAFALVSAPLADPDMVQYDLLARNLSAGRSFSIENGAPYAPTMFRDPGYPLFLASIYMTTGHDLRFAILAQILLHSLIAVLAYGMAKEVFSGKVAFLSGLLVAAFPTLANMSAYLMSETFFTFMLCLGVYTFLKAMKSGNKFYFPVSGGIFGIVILTKTASLFLPLAMIPVLFFINLKKKLNFKSLFAYSACFLIPCFLVVSAWSVRNKKVFDTFSLTLRGGDVMWSRAEKIDDSPKEILATAASSFSEYLGKKIFPDIIDTSKSYLYKDLYRVNELKTEYAKQGLTPDRIDKILKDEALAKISKHPFRYLAYTPVEAIKMTAFSYLPYLNEDRVHDYFGKTRNGDLVLALLKGVMRMIAYPILFLFLAAVIKNSRIWERWILVFTVILYFNVIYSLMDTIGRYAIPLIPFYCIFAVDFFFSDTNKHELHTN